MMPEKEKEKPAPAPAEKVKLSPKLKHVPKDAHVIRSILRDLNINDFEPRIMNQLLDFTYRYVTCILDDAKILANHARKKVIDLDDVKLASIVVLDKAFTTPPSRSLLTKLVEVRNAMPLPPIRPHCGLRLPPDRYCLSACNYKLRAYPEPRRMVKSAIEPRSSIKTTLKSSQAGVPLKRQSAAIAKTQNVIIPRPVFKYTAITKIVPPDSKPPNVPDIEVKTEIDSDNSSAALGAAVKSVTTDNIKREREDDDFEIVN